jgi:hypothetical protein
MDEIPDDQLTAIPEEAQESLLGMGDFALRCFCGSCLVAPIVDKDNRILGTQCLVCEGFVPWEACW